MLGEWTTGVRSVSDGIDPATSTGRLMLNLMATLAEYEPDLIVERVTAGIAAARESGIRFGRPPSDPAVTGRKLAIVDGAPAAGYTAADAANPGGWSRAGLYRPQAATEWALGEERSLTAVWRGS